MSSFTNTLINGGGSSVVTPDLLKDISKPITNTDYFDIVITDLRPDTSYNVQFAWIYADDSRSDYSATRTFSTDPETAPNVPSQPTVTAGPGLINVTWNGNNSTGQTLKNYAKVNIYVGGVLKDYFLSSGTKSIPLPKGTYLVTLRSSSATDTVSNATSPAVSVTVTADATDAAAALAGLDTKLNSAASGIVQSNNNITAINTSGITVYSGANSGSGARVVMNSAGIAGFNSTSTGPSNGATFAIDSSTGDAIFRGNITGSSGTFGGVTINSSGISTSNNIFTLNTAGSSTIGGWTIGSDKLYSGNIEFQTNNDPVLGYPSIKFFAGNNYNIYAFANFFGITNSTTNKDLIVANDTTVPGTMFLGGSGYQVRNSNTTIDNKQLRNIYVSSTAGEPSPSSPATGDIKLEW